MHPYVCNVYMYVCPAVRFHRSCYLQQVSNNTAEFVPLLLFKRFFSPQSLRTSVVRESDTGTRRQRCASVRQHTIYAQLLLLRLRYTPDVTRYNRLPRRVRPQHAWRSRSAKTSPRNGYRDEKAIVFFSSRLLFYADGLCRFP